MHETGVLFLLHNLSAGGDALSAVYAGGNQTFADIKSHGAGFNAGVAFDASVGCGRVECHYQRILVKHDGLQFGVGAYSCTELIAYQREAEICQHSKNYAEPCRNTAQISDRQIAEEIIWRNEIEYDSYARDDTNQKHQYMIKNLIDKIQFFPVKEPCEIYHHRVWAEPPAPDTSVKLGYKYSEESNKKSKYKQNKEVFYPNGCAEEKKAHGRDVKAHSAVTAHNEPRDKKE